MGQANIKRIEKLAWLLATANLGGEYKWNHHGDDFNDVTARAMSIFSSGNSIVDKKFAAWKLDVNVTKYLDDCFVVDKYYERIVPYIQSSKYFKVHGLDQFTNLDYSAGSQEAFLNHIMMNRDKRLRIFKGDYWWHLDVCDALGIQWDYIEDGDLIETDYIICSCPFALTGQYHKNMYDMLDICEQKGIGVLIDLIYLPNYQLDYKLDLNYDCINTITFSFSKTFPMQTSKIAVRLKKDLVRDPLRISNKENIENRLALGFGLEIMENFNINYMVDSYANDQTTWCDYLGLEKSPVVHFGLGDDYMNRQGQYSKYNIQSLRYNLGILYQNKDLLKSFLEKHKDLIGPCQYLCKK